MELSALISIVRRRWATALFAGLLVGGAILAQAVLSRPTPIYKVSAEIAFGGAVIEREQYVIYGDAQVARAVSLFAETALLPSVLSEAKAATGIGSPNVTVSSATLGGDSKAGLVRVTVTGDSRVEATRLLPEILDAAMRTTKAVAPKAGTGEPLVTTTALGEPTVVQISTSADLAKQLLLAIFAGLVVAFAAAVLRHLSSTRLVIVEDVIRAVAHRRSTAAENGLVPPVVTVIGSDADSHSTVRAVRDEVDTVPGEGLPILVLSLSEEGSFAEQLAYSWEAVGRRTLLLELGGVAVAVDGSDFEIKSSQVDETRDVATLVLGWSSEIISDRVASAAFAAALDAFGGTFERIVVCPGAESGRVSSLKGLASRSDVVIVCGPGGRKQDLADALMVVPAPGRAIVVFRS